MLRLFSSHLTTFAVIKACRDRGQIVFGQQPNLPDVCDYHSAKKNHGICEIRRVKIEKTKNEGLGISITGGMVVKKQISLKLIQNQKLTH